MRAVVIAMLLGGVASQAAAACDATSDLQSDMNICAHERYLAADRELNAAWKPTFAHFKNLDSYMPKNMAGAADQLLAAQKAWITYRDLACEAEGWNARGGSLEPFLVSSCLEDLTRARTERLKGMLEAWN